MSIHQAKDILARCLFVSPDSISDDDVIAEIKPVDSLAFETIMLEVEELTGQPVDPMTVLSIERVSDLAALISSETPS